MPPRRQMTYSQLVDYTFDESQFTFAEKTRPRVFRPNFRLAKTRPKARTLDDDVIRRLRTTLEQSLLIILGEDWRLKNVPQAVISGLTVVERRPSVGQSENSINHLLSSLIRFVFLPMMDELIERARPGENLSCRFVDSPLIDGQKANGQVILGVWGEETGEFGTKLATVCVETKDPVALTFFAIKSTKAAGQSVPSLESETSIVFDNSNDLKNADAIGVKIAIELHNAGTAHGVITSGRETIAVQLLSGLPFEDGPGSVVLLSRRRFCIKPPPASDIGSILLIVFTPLIAALAGLEVEEPPSQTLERIRNEVRLSGLTASQLRAPSSSVEGTGAPRHGVADEGNVGTMGAGSGPAQQTSLETQLVMRPDIVIGVEKQYMRLTWRFEDGTTSSMRIVPAYIVLSPPPPPPSNVDTTINKTASPLSATLHRILSTARWEMDDNDGSDDDGMQDQFKSQTRIETTQNTINEFICRDLISVSGYRAVYHGFPQYFSEPPSPTRTSSSTSTSTSPPASPTPPMQLHSTLNIFTPENTPLVINAISCVLTASVLREVAFYSHIVPRLSKSAQKLLPKFFGWFRGADYGHWYILLEYGGRPITDADLKKDPGLQERIDAAFDQIAAEGVEHDDRHLNNVLMKPDGSICLIDWGEAFLTHA